MQPPPLWAQIDDVRQCLLETSLKSRLIHVNRQRLSRQGLALSHPHADAIYRALLAGQTVPLELCPGAQGGPAVLPVDGLNVSDVPKLQRHLSALGQEVRAERQERGVHTLYLALGFLHFCANDGAQAARTAPLVLLPCDLIAAPQGQKQGLGIALQLRQPLGPLCSNAALARRLRLDYGVQLEPLKAEAEGPLGAYFERVGGAVGGRTGWRVDATALYVGRFSFGKIALHEDLAPSAWPPGTFEGHPLLGGLLTEGFADGAQQGPGEPCPAGVLPSCHVVPADSAQAEVVAATRADLSLIVEGPPGTGKSQTITNIIAGALKDNKRILFVAEKMAALQVVYKRLQAVGLGAQSLELFCHDTGKRAVLEELARTLAARPDAASAPEEGASAELDAVSGELLALDEALHRPIRQSGVSCFDVLGEQARVLGGDSPPVPLEGAELGALDAGAYERLAADLGRFGALLAATGPEHVFAGCKIQAPEPVEERRLQAELGQAAQKLRALTGELDKWQAAVGSVEPPTLEHAHRLHALGVLALELLPEDVPVALKLLQSPCLDLLQQAFAAGAKWQGHGWARPEGAGPIAGELPYGWLQPIFEAAAKAPWGLWGPDARAASRCLESFVPKPLPQGARARLALVEALHQEHQLRRAWQEHSALCAHALGGHWQGERSPFAKLQQLAHRCAQLRAAGVGFEPSKLCAQVLRGQAFGAELARLHRCLKQAGAAVAELEARLQGPGVLLGPAKGSGNPLQALEARLGAMADNVHRLGEWQALCALRRTLTKQHLGALAEGLWHGTLSLAQARQALAYARAEALFALAQQDAPILARLKEIDRGQLIATVQRLGRAQLKDNVTQLCAQAAAQLPDGAAPGMAVLRHELHQRRSPMSLRQLFDQLGETLQRIKPVMLMSPLSVAQYLTPGRHVFDLVLIDEASQVRPEDALGAIARGRQLVVVGDSKQLPPSAFFGGGAGGQGGLEEGEAGEDGPEGLPRPSALESILTLCAARGLPAKTLMWHYRSLVPSLMAVSNAAFYENKLILCPSAYQEDPDYGLSLQQVPGAYDAGGSRTNGAEAEQVALALAEHARQRPHQSIGIVTFSLAQRRCVVQQIERARARDAVLDAYLNAGHPEAVFVKNIESVQGDERDVILISVGYGPTEPGGPLTSLAFGPINLDGGERRLNVLFTRARMRCVVFVSFAPGALAEANTARLGPRLLGQYLLAAAKGAAPGLAPKRAPARLSALVQDVAQVVHSLGFTASAQVGTGPLTVDLAVRHPMNPRRFLLAIECDGPYPFEAAAVLERYGQKPQLLGHMGWRHHRILSCRWFLARAAEVERLRRALVHALAHGDGMLGQKPKQAPAQNAGLSAGAVPYVRAHPVLPGPSSLAETSATARLELVRRIIHLEGPIHIHELARRVAKVMGQPKVGPKMVALTERTVRAACGQHGELVWQRPFCFTQAQAKAPPVRDRSRQLGATLKAASISSLELRAALALAHKQLGDRSAEEVVQAAAQLLGFARPKAQLWARLAAHLQ